MNNNTTGAEMITLERARQIEVKKYNAEHDDTHSEGELCLAAISYAAPDRAYVLTRRGGDAFTFEDPWPWDEDSDNRRSGTGDIMSNSLNHQSVEDRIEQLAKAGAFLAAEIDRFQRLREENQ